MPKDGPSAGVTLASALASALTGRPVRSNVAMTGEVTLRGRVLPIGGLKEKTLAAHRAGVDTVIIPDENRKDLEDIPKNVADKIRFVIVRSMDEVLETALESPPKRALTASRLKSLNHEQEKRDIPRDISIENIDMDIERIKKIPVAEDPPLKV